MQKQKIEKYEKQVPTLFAQFLLLTTITQLLLFTFRIRQ